MKKTIIGLTGFTGSGKSVIANYLEKKSNYEVVRMGKYLRDLYSQEYLCTNELERIAEKFKSYSIGNLMQEEISKFHELKKIVVIDSLRTLADYKYFKSNADNFILVMVLANKLDRREWIKNRNRVDDGKNSQQLEEHELWETEFGLKNLLAVADCFIVNDGEKDDLIYKMKLLLDKKGYKI